MGTSQHQKPVGPSCGLPQWASILLIQTLTRLCFAPYAILAVSL